MGKTFDMRSCITIPANPEVGQILSMNGETAVWVTPDPYIDPWHLVGSIVWTVKGAAIVQLDGSPGALIQLFDNSEHDNPPGCRQQNYYLFNNEAVCVPPGGQDGQIIVYDCGKWRWRPMPEPCYCYGIEDVQAETRQLAGPAPSNVVTIAVPWCDCRGPNVEDVVGGVVCKCFGIKDIEADYRQTQNTSMPVVYVKLPFCFCAGPNVTDVRVRTSRGCCYG